MRGPMEGWSRAAVPQNRRIRAESVAVKGWGDVAHLLVVQVTLVSGETHNEFE